MSDLFINGINKFKLTSNGNFLKMSKEKATELFVKFGKDAFDAFKSYDFPYVEFDNNKIDNEIKTLKTMQKSDKTKSIAIKTFHKHIFKCSKNNKMSPYDFWNFLKQDCNFHIWKQIYVNRLMYSNKCSEKIYENGILSPITVLESFNVLHKADCVSYLKPMLSKRLIAKYLNEYETIFCPFNGFSGIMLGAVLGCNKNYIGQDINNDFISEANCIKDYISRFSDKSISLSCKDLFADKGKYDCLIACPPYKMLERWNFNGKKCIDKDLTCDQWIDECLSRYECKRYLFIVDDKYTYKHKKDCVEILTNRSHFDTNNELVILK